MRWKDKRGKKRINSKKGSLEERAKWRKKEEGKEKWDERYI